MPTTTTICPACNRPIPPGFEDSPPSAQTQAKRSPWGYTWRWALFPMTFTPIRFASSSERPGDNHIGGLLWIIAAALTAVLIWAWWKFVWWK